MIYISGEGDDNSAIHRMVEEIPPRFYATTEESRYLSGAIECVCLVPKRDSELRDVHLYITIHGRFTEYEVQQFCLGCEVIKLYTRLESALRAYEKLAYADGCANERR